MLFAVRPGIGDCDPVEISGGLIDLSRAAGAGVAGVFPARTGITAHFRDGYRRRPRCAVTAPGGDPDVDAGF